MNPHVAVTRHVELSTCHILVQSDKVGNTILHGDSEAVTKKSRGPKALVKLLIQMLLKLAQTHVNLETGDEGYYGSEDGVALPNRDVLHHVPGELSQSADHALIRALWAVTREGRL